MREHMSAILANDAETRRFVQYLHGFGQYSGRGEGAGVEEPTVAIHHRSDTQNLLHVSMVRFIQEHQEYVQKFDNRVIEERRNHAKAIFSEFLAVEAPDLIGIPSGHRDHLQAICEGCDTTIHKSIFKATHNGFIDVLSTEAQPPYLESKLKAERASNVFFGLSSFVSERIANRRASVKNGTFERKKIMVSTATKSGRRVGDAPRNSRRAAMDSRPVSSEREKLSTRGRRRYSDPGPLQKPKGSKRAGSTSSPWRASF